MVGTAEHSQGGATAARMRLAAASASLLLLLDGGMGCEIMGMPSWCARACSPARASNRRALLMSSRASSLTRAARATVPATPGTRTVRAAPATPARAARGAARAPRLPCRCAARMTAAAARRRRRRRLALPRHRVLRQLRHHRPAPERRLASISARPRATPRLAVATASPPATTATAYRATSRGRSSPRLTTAIDNGSRVFTGHHRACAWWASRTTTCAA